MQEFIYDSWNGVMNADKNPLRHIPDNMTRHMILQILAWTWCTSFSLWIGSITFFGFTAIAHTFILAAIVITVMTFETAKRNPTFFIKISEFGTIEAAIIQKDAELMSPGINIL